MFPSTSFPVIVLSILSSTSLIIPFYSLPSFLHSYYYIYITIFIIFNSSFISCMNSLIIFIFSSSIFFSSMVLLISISDFITFLGVVSFLIDLNTFSTFSKFLKNSFSASNLSSSFLFLSIKAFADLSSYSLSS